MNSHSFLLVACSILTFSVAIHAYDQVPCCGFSNATCREPNKCDKAADPSFCITRPLSPPINRRDRYVSESGRIIDITHPFTASLPLYGSTHKELLGKFLTPVSLIATCSITNNAEYTFQTHYGTHVDCPGHAYQEYLDAGYDTDSLDLGILNGPAIVVDVPREKNITAAVLRNIKMPPGTKRVLFRTLNTDRRLMSKPFDSSYVGFTEDGADWLVKNTCIKLVGVDYLSVASYDQLSHVHRILLRNADIVVVEGLNLGRVEAKRYDLHCLPLRMRGADGSPTRCIVISKQ